MYSHCNNSHAFVIIRPLTFANVSSDVGVIRAYDICLGEASDAIWMGNAVLISVFTRSDWGFPTQSLRAQNLT